MMRVSHASRIAAKCCGVNPAQSTGISLAAVPVDNRGMRARAASPILALRLDGA